MHSCGVFGILFVMTHACSCGKSRILGLAACRHPMLLYAIGVSGDQGIPLVFDVPGVFSREPDGWVWVSTSSCTGLCFGWYVFTVNDLGAGLNRHNLNCG